MTHRDPLPTVASVPAALDHLLAPATPAGPADAAVHAPAPRLGAAAGPRLRVRVVLGAGRPRRWQLRCLQLLQAPFEPAPDGWGGQALDIEVCQPRDGAGPSAAVAHPVPELARADWPAGLAVHDVDAPVDRPADVALALDAEAAAWLGRCRRVQRRWVLANGEGQLLGGAWPLLGTITRQQGLELRLLEQGGRAQAWRQRRHARHAASPHYPVGVAGLAEAAAALVRQALRDLALGLPAGAPVAMPAAAVAPAPASVARSRLAGAWRAWCQRQKARWLSESWRIGVVDAPPMAWIADRGRLPVHWITAEQRQGYWADPMGMVGDSQRLFCEYYDERTGLGHLEALQLDTQGQVASRQRLAVGGGAHVSFPLVVELDGRRLGVAEAAATRECLLYEVGDDGLWQPVATLLQGVSAADPALFKWEGRYWLAYTDLRHGSDNNLCLQHADRLEGPWQPHANNPVRTDVGAARMAGGLFEHGGRLYRPAQDCLRHYGAAVVLHQVLRCNPTEYLEEAVARIAPDPDGPCPDGLHTLSVWGNRTLIDGKRMALNPVAVWRKLRQRTARAPAAAGGAAVAAGAVGAGGAMAPSGGSRGADASVTAGGFAPAGPVGTDAAAVAAVPLQRVMVYVPHLRMGGGEISMLRLAGGLARSGLQVQLVVHRRETIELELPEGVDLLSLDCDGTLGAVTRLARLLKAQRPQVLLSGFPHTNLAALAARALSRAPVRTVVSEHAPLSRQIDGQGGWRYRALPPLVRLAYARADAVVAVSAGVRDDLQALAGTGLPLHVLPNPVIEDEALRPSEQARPPHPWLRDSALQVVISVSRLSVEKDLPTLLNAFAELHRSRPRTRLVVAGDGPEKAALQALARQLGLEAVVHFPGRLAQPMAWMRHAAVFAHASRYEGFGNVIVEALAAGTRVVATDCPVGPREVLQDGRHGHLVPVGDAAAMAQALAQALDGPPLPEASRRYAAQFTTGRACAGYRALFERLVSTRGGRPC